MTIGMVVEDFRTPAMAQSCSDDDDERGDGAHGDDGYVAALDFVAIG